MKPEALEIWLPALRQFSLAIIGIAGLSILLLKYWTTGDVSIPAFTGFAALLGLNSLAIGRGSVP